jgi:hypothetical protein
MNQATLSQTLADLIGPMSEEMCRGCPPDRVCAWACQQGWGITDNALAARLGLNDADGEAVKQALCECYN